MDGFFLLCGHMLGDFMLQNDWQATNKVVPYPRGPQPLEGPEALKYDMEHAAGDIGTIACLTHCSLYTISIVIFSWWWMPLWGIATTFLTHYIIDRNRLARTYMKYCGQEKFATGVFSPWSILAVDFTMHMLVFAAIIAIKSIWPH